MTTKPEDFGTTVTNSRWFNREPLLKKVKVRPVGVHWECPMDGCDGDMNFNGMTWPTANPGQHHTCTKCGFTAAITGHRYPEIQYEDLE